MTTNLPAVPRQGTVGREDWSTVTGTPNELRALVAAAQAAGMVVMATRPVSVPHQPGRYAIRLRFVESRRRARPRRLRRPLLAALVVVAAAGMVTALVAVVLTHLLDVLIVLALAGLLVVGLGRAGVCPGIHCPGCRHR